MTNVIVVGAGEYYQKIVGPSLALLNKQGIINVLALVDIKESITNDLLKIGAKYARRERGQKLSELLRDFKDAQPVVLLGHANELHLSDAADLLENGFSVALEKPYCTKTSELNILKDLLDRHVGRFTLLEYYLMMKSAPLLIAAGKIKNDSFYTKEDSLLESFEYSRTMGGTSELFGRLAGIVGKARSVDIELLEGEGLVGRLDHRGPHLCSINKGGGMILDLGLHALCPLFALRDIVGNVDDGFKDGSVKIARCDEYIEMAQEKFGLEANDIAETYAEIEFTTGSGVPVRAGVGKYVLPNQNRRHITIYGDSGAARMDLSDCYLEIKEAGGEWQKVLMIPKKPESKYYAVLRSALDALSDKNPFTFDSNEVAFLAQSFIMNVRQAAYRADGHVSYRKGANPGAIFEH